MVREQRSREERGAIAVLAAIVLLVVGGFMALSLNVGHLMNARTQMQGALDSAALAGARELDGTSGGLTAARNVAVTFGTRHYIDRMAVGMGVSDVTAGYWDKATKSFFTTGQTVTIGDSTVTLDPAATAPYYNAVSARSVTDGVGSHNSQLDVWFGAFLGNIRKTHTGASAVAVGGGPCTDTGCTLPLAVPSCALLDNGGNLACGTTMTLNFNHGHGKDIAFADITQPSGQPNPNTVIDQNHAAQTCTNPTVKVGDTVRLSNGNFFNNHVEDSFYGPDASMVCNAAYPYTNCPRKEVAVVNIGTNCGVPMNQSHSVVGFVQVVITGTQSTPGNARSITVYLDCNGGPSNSGASGCASFGWGSQNLRLVR